MRNAMLVAKLLVVALPAATAASAAPIHRPSARPQLVRSALSLRGGAAVGGSPSPGGGGAQMVPPHASTAKDVLEQAGVVADAGLSDARAAELLKKFGRNELEADATGLTIAALACYDVRRSTHFMRKLSEATGSRPTSWWATHPATEDRYADLRRSSLGVHQDVYGSHCTAVGKALQRLVTVPR